MKNDFELTVSDLTELREIFVHLYWYKSANTADSTLESITCSLFLRTCLALNNISLHAETKLIVCEIYLFNFFQNGQIFVEFNELDRITQA